MAEPVSTWNQIPGLLKFEEYVRSVPSVNDACERLCARTSQYANCCGKDEDEFQNVLQIVEEAITAVPSRKLKSDLIKSYDNE